MSVEMRKTPTLESVRRVRVLLRRDYPATFGIAAHVVGLRSGSGNAPLVATRYRTTDDERI